MFRNNNNKKQQQQQKKLPSYRTVASDLTCAFLDFSGSFNL